MLALNGSNLSETDRGKLQVQSLPGNKCRYPRVYSSFIGQGRVSCNRGINLTEQCPWALGQGQRYLTPEEQLARYRERFGELPESVVSAL